MVLSNIRRVLGGGLVADREAVRLDLATVQLDLAALQSREVGLALAHGGDLSLRAASLSGKMSAGSTRNAPSSMPANSSNNDNNILTNDKHLK